MNEITSYNDKKDEDIRIPRGRNNTELKLEHLNDDQFKVAFLILRKIREWINLLDQPPSKQRQFKPLHMTVIGCAGAGKSVLINTVVGYIRKMFQDNNSVVVAEPTGAAAHNVGGQTIMHREFKIGIGKNKKWNISKKAKEKLSKKME